MSFEQRVVQLEETNAELVKEVVRVRDAAMGLNRMYPTVTEGRQTVADGQYFSVPGDGTYQRLYRRNGAQAELIAEYPSKEALAAAVSTAVDDAEARASDQADRAQVEADRANTYADNAGYVTRERLRKQATIDLDFVSGDYALDDGEKLRTTNAGEVLTVERATPKWVFGPNGKLREVPPDTVAREWDPVTGEPLGVLLEPSRTNKVRYSMWSSSLFIRDGFSQSPLMDLSGGEGAIKFAKEAGETGSASIDLIGAASGAVDTLSFFFYPVEGDIKFMLRNGTKGQNFSTLDVDASNVPTGDQGNGWKIEEVHSGWFFAEYTMSSGQADATDSGDNLMTYLGSTGGTESVRLEVHISHLQLEEGTYATSRIPTNGSPATRAYDRLGNVFNTEELFPSDLTVVVRGTVLQPGAGGGVNLGVISGSSPGFRIGVFSSDNRLLVRVGTRNVFAGDLHSPFRKEIAIAFSLSQDGSMLLRISGLSSTYNVELTEEETSEMIRLLKRESGTTLITRINDGVTRGASYSVYPRAMTEAELIELTTIIEEE